MPVVRSMCFGYRKAVMPESGLLTSGDWVIGTGFAAQAAPGGSNSFYAIYDNTAFAESASSEQGRGLAAIIAQSHPDLAHPDLASSGGSARDAAQLAVHSFAEGYFGAQRTLSPRRAALR